MSVKSRISIVVADITKLEGVQAIVNAANSSLLGGGGVDGAIHRAAGPELNRYCEREFQGPKRCPTGESRITPAFNLKHCEHVIHTVGPVWHGGSRREPELLKSCYQTSLQLATENDIDSIAFPGISTGIYGYPLDAASKEAVGTVVDYLKSYPKPSKVVFCAFAEENAESLKKALDAIAD
ncbi:hypothetical protein FOZ61_009372 [Perkinsus olseni]|uniref:Macro domain-containing protein n=1 Tax=Perkinsus olseni TaxID=32597 RepID=A0A7J6M594_PEROL|nr:hypothetical protein FOZ61_009372 [Perkinsus olseni]KAF4671264.1 hypothetical protein FOL46_000362 [Perkinsus olseni]